MTESQDREITLGTGKMLVLFFALVALCAVFFGIGFALGKNSAQLTSTTDSLSLTGSPGGVRPSAAKSAGGSPAAERTAYKAGAQKNANAPPVTHQDASNPSATGASPSDSKPTPAEANTAPPLNGYYVQVAAVSKQEDAEALVEALEKKQYPAFAANTSTDKLFHVEVGPFADIREAEGTRAKLVSDGYNPILKK